MPTAPKLTDVQADIATLNKWNAKVAAEINTLNSNLDRVEVTANTATTTGNTLTADTSLASNVTSVSATESGYVIDGVLFSEVTASYHAPSPLANFGGIFLVVQNYRGSSDLVKVAEDTFTGAAGGAKSFKVTLQRTNETITLFFVSKNSLEGTGAWSAAPSTTVLLDGNASAPSAPVGLVATSSNIGVNLSWTQNVESNLAGYKVYRNTTNTFGSATVIANVGVTLSGTPSYSDSTGSFGSVYFYWVTAVNNANLESGASSGVTGIPGGGSITATILTGNFGSATTTSSITLYWDGTNSSIAFVLRFPSGATITPPTGSQAITGLSSNHTYSFYPYYDIANNVVNFVASGAGTPAIAYASPSDAAAQTQFAPGLVPLANGAVTASTTASGSGGGGVPKGCLAPWASLAGEDGPIRADVLKVGDKINTPNGWTTVTKLHTPEQTALVRVSTPTKFLDCSPAHPLALSNGNWVYAGASMPDMEIETSTGPEKITSVICTPRAYVSVFPSCEPHHEFYANGILTHNFKTY